MVKAATKRKAQPSGNGRKVHAIELDRQESPFGPPTYLVTKTVNTLAVHPGEEMSEARVRDLIDATNLDVRIRKGERRRGRFK